MFEDIFTLFIGIIIGVAACLLINAIVTFKILSMGNKIYSSLVKKGIIKPKEKPKMAICENGHRVKDFQFFYGCPVCKKNEEGNKKFVV